MPAHRPTGRLSPDPAPGSEAWNRTRDALEAERLRLLKLQTLAARLPVALTDARCRVRDHELRLGLNPSHPAPKPTD